MIIIHIFLALSSLLLSGITWFKPSYTRLHVVYGLTAGTLISGTYLVMSLHQPLVSSCEAGLIYLGVSLAGILATHYKLAHQETE